MTHRRLRSARRSVRRGIVATIAIAATAGAFSLVGTASTDLPKVDAPEIAPPSIPAANAPAAPTDLTATAFDPAVCAGTELRWTDASDDETDFRIDRSEDAAPEFRPIATIATTSMPGRGGVMTWQDRDQSPFAAYTYRVVAISPAGGESAPSNEAHAASCVVVPAPARWLDVQLGRARSDLRDGARPGRDSVVVRGSYSVIDVDASVPVVVRGAEPRADGIAIQISAPASLVAVVVPPGDPRWVAARGGVFRWRTRGGRRSPASSIRLDAWRSEFTFRSRGHEFVLVPAATITVSLTFQGATGTDTRVWDRPPTATARTRARFTFPR